VATQFERDLYCLRCAGYCVIPRFLTGQLLTAIVDAAAGFEDEVARFAEQGGEVILRHGWPLRTTRCLYAVSSEVQNLVMSDTIQSLAKAYLEEPVLRDCLVQTNMPDSRNAERGADADVSYHRDTLWPELEIRPIYLHCFLLLTDFTVENGATIVVPGSHLIREPDYYFKHTDPRSRQQGIDYRVYERRYFPSSVQLIASRGSLVLLDPMTIHTQGTNTSPYPRSLLNMTFRAGDVNGRPPLLNSRLIAERFSRVPVRSDFLDLLESDSTLPAHFGPLGNACHQATPG
jgi:ectoine hydroxylase-related dioxygenase (phytanoyl-CoA dioxygenase family)